MCENMWPKREDVIKPHAGIKRKADNGKKIMRPLEEALSGT
jgi:hypothetical protein